MLEPDCTVGLTISGALTPGRPGDELPDPPDQGGVRRLDRLHRRQPLSRHPLRPRPPAPPEPPRTSTTLRSRENDVIRIYDIVFDYKTLLDTDAFYRELIRDDSFARPMGTAEFHHQVGQLSARPRRELGRPSPTACSPRLSKPACRFIPRAPATARSA